MENNQLHKRRSRKKRSLRVRQHLRGSEEKPRLCVMKSAKHLYVQLIDDERAITLASISTLSKEFKNTEYNRKSKGAAKQLGLRIAALAKEKNVSMAVFDRGPFQYHGVMASLADGAREGGLKL